MTTDREIFENPYGVAVALITVLKGDKRYLLGVRRGIEPCLDGICLPGGYINNLETAKMAGVREVVEETNLVLNENDFMLYDEGISANNRHLIFILHKKNLYPKDIDFKFTCDETREVLLLDPAMDLCFPLHDKAAKRFFSEFDCDAY
jgi:ADP-ribose pyrophosphatase YjhB (NUDIX family)